jgi:hypothetical protein
VQWALQQGSVWDLVYEACSYFNQESLGNAMALAGFESASVDHGFGGQYLMMLTRRSRPSKAHELQAGPLPELAARFGERWARQSSKAAEALSALAERAPTAAWGAAAKGMTFVNMMDRDAEQLRCVVDINPRKQGAYIPGTGHPIIGPEALADHGVKQVIVVNPNYLDEIGRTVREMDPEITVIDWRSLFAQ